MKKQVLLSTILLLSMFAFMVPMVSAHELFIYPIEDSWVVDVWPDGNYGTSTTLHARSDTDQIRRTYLKFDMRHIDPSKVCGAELKMHVKASTPGGYIDVDTCELDDDGWREYTITWNNAPAPGPVIITTGVDGVSSWTHDWNGDPMKNYVIAQITKDGIVSIVVKIPNDEAKTNTPVYHRDFDSRETGLKPFLAIVYEQWPCIPEFGLSSMIVASMAFVVLIGSKRIRKR